MPVLIPNYLINYAILEKSKKDCCEFFLKCECGNLDFEIYNNEYSQEEKEKQKKWNEAFIKRFGRGFEGYSDENGKVYFIKRNIFGKIIDKMPATEMPEFNTRVVILCKCSKCKKETIIFDNQEHGYDGIFNTPNKNSDQLIFKQKKFKNTIKSLAGIKIIIQNDESYDSFVENTGLNVSKEIYSNAFSWIKINAFVREQNNRKVEIYQEETA